MNKKIFKIKKPSSSGIGYENKLQQAIVNKWFENQTELKKVENKDTHWTQSIFTDGINELTLNDSCVYIYSSCDNFGYINFFTQHNKKFFDCKIEDYKKGDEKKALRDYIENKQTNDLLKDREKSLKIALDKTKKNGLPKLKGTPKQISWATQIRINLLEKANLLTLVGFDFNKDYLLNKLKLIPCTSHSTFWINNKDQYGNDLINFIKNYEEQMDELSFQKFWKLTKKDIKKIKKPSKTTKKSQKINMKLGTSSLNVGISNADFIKYVNKFNFNFYNKLSDKLKEKDSLFFVIYKNQTFGNKKVFFIKTYDEINNYPFMKNLFFVGKNVLYKFIEYEKKLSDLRTQKSNLLSNNNNLHSFEYISNIHAHGRKIADELNQIEKEIIDTKTAYQDALCLDENQYIQKILDVINEEYNCCSELIKKNGKCFIYKISKLN